VIAEITFLVLALIMVAAGIKMVTTDEPVHAAVYLALVLIGVAGIYLTLGAEFLAAIQILIYVGAVTTLILFAVMLTTHSSPMEGFAEDRTPLSTLGIDAPKGMDVESLEEVPTGVESVREAESEAGEGQGDGYTVKPSGTEPPEDGDVDDEEASR